jgi:isoleucyl-tRNA synthetase
VADKIIFQKDGKEYKRVPEVLDVWMDSGSVPFAEYHYPFENQELYEKAKPADFIVEYVGQIRAWFNVLLRVSTILFDDTSFKTALCTGVMAGNDGRKMSKSFGNYPDPKMILEKYGGDALRLYFMGSPIMKGEDMNVMEEGMAENYRFLLTLWNCYKFFVDYGNLFNWSCELEGGNGDKSHLKVMDRWILSRLSQLTLEVRKSMDNYDIVNAVRILKEFLVEDYSTWYIRLNRGRVSNNDSKIDRNAALSVMYGVLCTYIKLSAPVIPFITEEIYRNIAFDESVHLSTYPKGDASLVDEQLMADMVLVRQIVERGHALRKEANMKLRQPLQSVTYQLNKKLNEDLEGIVAGELNVKEVLYTEVKRDVIDEKSVALNTEITPELQKEGDARELLRQVQQLRKTEGLTLQDKIELTLPSWPEEFEEMIKKGVQAVSITKGENISIKKV